MTVRCGSSTVLDVVAGLGATDEGTTRIAGGVNGRDEESVRPR